MAGHRRSSAGRAAINTICATLCALAGHMREWAEQGSGSALAAAGADWAGALEVLAGDLENARSMEDSLNETTIAGRELLAALSAAAAAAAGVPE